jgi:hypothetical protein
MQEMKLMTHVSVPSVTAFEQVLFGFTHYILTTHNIHILGQITIKVSNRQTTFSQLLLDTSRPLLHQVVYVWHWSKENKHECQSRIITLTL